MPAFLSKVSDQMTGFWNKIEMKQKIQIIIAFCFVLIALIALALILSNPRMVPFVSGLEPKTTAEVRAVLQEQGISHEVINNATAINVEARRKQDAQMALDSLGVISNVEMTYQEAFNSGISTTENERRLKFKLAFEHDLAERISVINAVDSAIVKLVVPMQDRSIFDDKKESTASAILTSNRVLSEEQVLGIAHFLASSVENLTINNVTIIDSTGKLLFYGESSMGVNTSLSSQLSYKESLENKIERDILSVLLARSEYDDAVVTVGLVINFDSQSSVKEEFSTPEGQSKGIVRTEYQYESEGTSSTPSGVPGTDSNDGATGYYMPDASSSGSSTVISQVEYDVNKTITNRIENIGDILYSNSTIAVVVNRFIYYYQDILEQQGTLDTISWEEFKNTNDIEKKITIDEDIISLVKMASNIDNVKIIGYEVPVFINREAVKSPIMEQIPIVIIVIMIGLLGYAVYKGTEPVEITEIEPELSVEDMLATTKEQNDLDIIEFDEKSDSRVQIEKFVDEKPDAVAQLLRNWLNEEWE